MTDWVNRRQLEAEMTLVGASCAWVIVPKPNIAPLDSFLPEKGVVRLFDLEDSDPKYGAPSWIPVYVGSDFAGNPRYTRFERVIVERLE